MNIYFRILILYLFEHKEDESGYQPLNLFILNKLALVKCFDRYLSVFQAVIGEQFCFEWFTSELEKKKTLEEIIKKK